MRHKKRPPKKGKRTGEEFGTFDGRDCIINWDDTRGNLVRITILEDYIDNPPTYFVSKDAIRLGPNPKSVMHETLDRPTRGQKTLCASDLPAPCFN